MGLPLNDVLSFLENNGWTVLGLISTLLAAPQDQYIWYVPGMYPQLPAVLDGLSIHPVTAPVVRTWVVEHFSHTIHSELSVLVDKQSGFHFNAVHAQFSQIEDFSIPRMAGSFCELAPTLWNFFNTIMMMHSDPLGRNRVSDEQPEDEDDIDSEEYWTPDENEGNAGHSRGTKRTRMAGMRRRLLAQIRSVVCISICMTAVNQWANWLQAIMGFFLHSSGTPELVIKTLAHAGISISSGSIDLSIDSLSQASAQAIRTLGQTLSACWCFDNIGWHQRPADPTVNNQFIHVEATTCMFLPMEHGTSKDDLTFAADLWCRNPMNPSISVPAFVPTFDHIIELAKASQGNMRPIADGSGSILSRRNRILVWHVLNVLVSHGPLAQFAKDLGEPEAILPIPVKKTIPMAGHAMHLNEGTHDGIAAVFANMELQAGIGHPDEKNFQPKRLRDLNDYNILVHLDLGSIEKWLGIQQSRAIEKNPRRRLQYGIPVPGLLHVQMAAEESLHRIYIAPVKSRTVLDSVFEHVGLLRPKETGYFSAAKGPGYRRMHRFIHHDVIVCLLDCWRTHLSRINPTYFDLEVFAQSQPSWSDLVKIAEAIVLENIAGKEYRKDILLPEANRDQVFENAQLRLRDFLLYVELHHAITHGDIGRVESVLLDWSFIFRAIGKHKYAAFMLNTLMNLNFVYPARMRAFRLNWLCNPRGNTNTFRAVDWYMERNNLYIKLVKRIYGGTGPNRTIEYILKQSPLIDLFRACHFIIRDAFVIETRTLRHGDPSMQPTYSRLLAEMKKNEPHRKIDGRKTEFAYRDAIYEGLESISIDRNFLVVSNAEQEELSHLVAGLDIEDFTL